MPASLKFVDGSSSSVSFGLPAHLQDIAAGAIIVWVFPSVWPTSTVRSILHINGSADGYHQFNTSGISGTLGLRFVLDRATDDLTVSASPANIPHTAAGKWCQWAAVWNAAGADSAQKLYGGDINNPLTEVTTYVAQTVGVGSPVASTNLANTVTGGSGGFPGSVFVLAVFNRAPSVADLRQHSADLANRCVPPSAIGCWFYGAHGYGRVWDETGYGAHGTTIGTTPLAPTLPELAIWPTRRRIRAKAPAAGILRQMLQHAH